MERASAWEKQAEKEPATILDAVENEGWYLEHVGYVYRLTESDSRTKFMSSGLQAAFGGEIIGIYLFRRSTSEH
jgi:hypothetical protein